MANNAYNNKIIYSLFFIIALIGISALGAVYGIFDKPRSIYVGFATLSTALAIYFVISNKVYFAYFFTVLLIAASVFALTSLVNTSSSTYLHTFTTLFIYDFFSEHNNYPIRYFLLLGLCILLFLKCQSITLGVYLVAFITSVMTTNAFIGLSHNVYLMLTNFSFAIVQTGIENSYLFILSTLILYLSYCLNEKSLSKKLTFYILCIVSGLMVLNLAFCHFLKDEEHMHSKDLTETMLDSHLNELQTDAREINNSIYRFGQRWEMRNGIPYYEWQHDASNYIATIPHLRAIEWVDAQYIIQWVVPKKSNELIIGLDLKKYPDRLAIANAAKERKTISTTQTIKLKQGSRGYLIYMPLTVKGEFDGFIVAIVDIKYLFEEIVNYFTTNGQSITIVENNHIIARGDIHDSDSSRWHVSKDLLFDNTRFTFIVSTPHVGFFSKGNIFPLIVFFSCCIVIFIIVLAIRFAFLSKIFKQKAQEQNLRFKQIVELSPSAMILVSNSQIIELINAEAESLFGYTREELIGQHLNILLPKEVATHHDKLFNNYIGGNDNREMAENRTVYGLNKREEKIPLEIYLCSMSLPSGKKILANIYDITQKNKRIAQLSKAENDLNRASEIAKVGGWELDLLTNKLSWSDQTFRIHALDKNYQPTVEKAINFYPDDAKKVITQSIEHAIETGEDWDEELPFVRANGQRIWVRAKGEVEFSDEKPIKLVGILQDITEKKLFTQELERRNDELDRFAYIASHDLKAPLRGIDQLATWLHEDLFDSIDEDSKNHLKLMRGRISRMEKMLKDLLIYARAGSKEGQPEEVDTNELIRNIFELNCSEKFTLHISNSLPIFKTTKTPFELVIRNILTNAVKHHDNTCGEIRISSKHIGERFWFSIADDGPGIAQTHQEKAFQIFQTLKPRDKVDGSGMGLAIIKKTVESFGGDITLTSNLPRGLVVSFSWPDHID